MNSQLSFLSSTSTYATHPVWKDSTPSKVRFVAQPKKALQRIYFEARRWERSSRGPNRQDGAIGRNGLAVLQSLIFDFYNWKSGRLDPGYAAIAAKAGLSIRSVARGLARLKACGILNWIRRKYCGDDGLVKQETNAYALITPNQWSGFFYQVAGSTAPEPGTTGEHPPIPSALEAGAAALSEGYGREAAITALENDPTDLLAAALGRLGRWVVAVD